MSAVAKAANKQLEKVKTPMTLAGMTSDQVVAVLGNHDLKWVQLLGNKEEAQRFKQIIAFALMNDKKGKLRQCETKSIIGAALEGASTGLDATPALHNWCMVPYKNKASFQFEYPGLVRLARRSQLVKEIWAEVVREGDEFEEVSGLHRNLIHKKKPGNRGQLLYAYACVQYTNGGCEFVVLDREHVLSVKERAPGGSYPDSPWNDPNLGEPEMWRKTALRKLMKTCQLETKIQRHIAVDEGIITEDDFDASGGGINPDTVERPDYTVEDDDEPEGDEYDKDDGDICKTQTGEITDEKMPDNANDTKTGEENMETPEVVAESGDHGESNQPPDVADVPEKMTPEEKLLVTIREIEEAHPTLAAQMRNSKTPIGKIVKEISKGRARMKLDVFELQIIVNELNKAIKEFAHA